jgi:hypothetical protein
VAEEWVDLGCYRRRWQRLHTNVPVRILVRTLDCIQIVDGRGTELNERGLAVYAGVELKVGDCVSVELKVPDSERPLRLTAAVRNRTGYLYGLQFKPVADGKW